MHGWPPRAQPSKDNRQGRQPAPLRILAASQHGRTVAFRILAAAGLLASLSHALLNRVALQTSFPASSIAAATDMMLQVIGKQHGADIATEVADQMVYNAARAVTAA